VTDAGLPLEELRANARISAKAQQADPAIPYSIAIRAEDPSKR